MREMRYRARPAVGALALLLFFASAATGQPSDPQEERRTAYYAQGVAAATAGRWTEAKERFAAALAIRSSPRVLFSLAQAEEQLGQVATASSDYRRALEGAKTAGDRDVATAAEEARAAIAARIPHIRLVVSGATNVTVAVDGSTVDPGSPVAVDPGAHHIVVRAPMMREKSTNITIAERQELEVRVALEPAAVDRQ